MTSLDDELLETNRRVVAENLSSLSLEINESDLSRYDKILRPDSDEDDFVLSTPVQRPDRISPTISGCNLERNSSCSPEKRSKTMSSGPSKTADIFDADEVINRELESLVPTNADGTKSKKALSKYVDTKMRGSRKGKKKITSRRKLDVSSPNISQYFTPSKSHKNNRSIDELLKSPSDDCALALSPSWKSLQEMTRELRQLSRTNLERNAKHEKDQKLRKDYFEENARMRDDLQKEFSPEKARSWVKENKDQIADIWSGKVGSSRYEAFHRSTEARHGLLYHMITHPFNDEQLEAIIEEISVEWMPTKKLREQKIDFVWKVVLAEILILIYMDFFDIETKAEAEKRISFTPFNDDKDNCW